MKTAIVSQGAEPVAAETFPALYKHKPTGEVVVAYDETRGFVVHSIDDNYRVGYHYDQQGSKWKGCLTWERLTAPVTITFTP